jgi:hypothetical protein
MADLGFWDSIARDLTGKGQLRLIIEPLLAIVLGIRHGLTDARHGEEPFLRLTNRIARHAGRSAPPHAPEATRP